MGAFDTYSAIAPCPRCRDLRWVSGQTKFFLPEYETFGGLSNRHFEPGAPQPLDFSPAELTGARVWGDEWWRVREPGSAGDTKILAGFDDVFGCACGARYAVILGVSFAEGPRPTATLSGITLVDFFAPETTATSLAAQIDFASGEHIVHGLVGELGQLAAAPPTARAARLHAALDEHITRWFNPSPPSELDMIAWRLTNLRGPVRCEHCGDTRERDVPIHLSILRRDQTFFGPAWTGGDLRPGTRIAGDTSWLVDDVDRGCFLRLRHPISPNRLCLLGEPETWGCPCGAGRASVVMRCTYDPWGITLDTITTRVVRSRDDLADIDFAITPTRTRAIPGEPAHGAFRPSSREEAMEALLYADWRLPKPGS